MASLPSVSHLPFYHPIARLIFLKFTSKHHIILQLNVDQKKRAMTESFPYRPSPIIPTVLLSLSLFFKRQFPRCPAALFHFLSYSPFASDSQLQLHSANACFGSRTCSPLIPDLYMFSSCLELSPSFFPSCYMTPIFPTST